MKVIPKMVYFCLQIVNSFEIGSDRTRIGVVVFSEQVNLIFHLDQ